eukprot:4511293-Pleurochrysis_carterae.AAC.1
MEPTSRAANRREHTLVSACGTAGCLSESGAQRGRTAALRPQACEARSASRGPEANRRAQTEKGGALKPRRGVSSSASANTRESGLRATN